MHLSEQPRSGTRTRPHAGEAVQQQDRHSWLGGQRTGAAAPEDGPAVSHRATGALSARSSQPAPQRYPKELKTYIHIKTCTQMIIAALLITAKT